MNDEKIIPALKLEQIPTKNRERQMEGISLPEKPGIGFGIEETKDVVVFGISLANSIIKAFRDGNITLIDIPLFIAPLTKLPSALSGINMVPFEIGDIEKFELQQLITFVKENLDVDEREAKNIIELSLLMIYDIYDLIKAIKQL